MNALFQLLSEQDLPVLLEMMREFYAGQHMVFELAGASRAVKGLLDNPDLGQIYLVFRGSDLAGYFTLTFCYSLEYHGQFGLLDELYLRESFRGQKLGSGAIAFAESLCRQRGIKALRLEVGRDNPSAQELYRRQGLVEDARNLMTKWLSPEHKPPMRTS